MFNLSLICQQLPPWAHIILWLGFLIWEYGLGKTRIGSTLGAVQNFVRYGKFSTPLPVSNALRYQNPKV